MGWNEAGMSEERRDLGEEWDRKDKTRANMSRGESACSKVLESAWNWENIPEFQIRVELKCS